MPSQRPSPTPIPAKMDSSTMLHTAQQYNVRIEREVRQYIFDSAHFIIRGCRDL